MENVYEVYGKTLVTQTVKVSFDYNIEKVILHDDVFVVLLAVTDNFGKVVSNIYDNVYGVSLQGKILWRIDAGSLQDGKTIKEMFTGVNVAADGTFFAITFFAMRHYFDYKTGRLLKREAMRW